ncbi:MAG: NB-ARC domain-containing protein, partial [Cyanobacteria bacterium J06648_11]
MFVDVDEDELFAAIVYEAMDLHQRVGGAKRETRGEIRPVFQNGALTDDVRSILTAKFSLKEDESSDLHIESWVKMAHLFMGRFMRSHFTAEEGAWDMEAMLHLFLNLPAVRDQLRGGLSDAQLLTLLNDAHALRNDIAHSRSIKEDKAQKHRETLLKLLDLLVGGDEGEAAQEASSIMAAEVRARIELAFGIQVLKQRNNLPGPDASFVGREEDLKRVEEAIEDEGAAVGVYGVAGVGKTWLARRVARSFLRKREEHVAFVVHAESEGTIRQDFCEILRCLGKVGEAAWEKKSTSDLGKMVRVALQSRRNWLLLFDNVYEDRDTDETERKGDDDVVEQADDDLWKRVFFHND